MSQAGSFGGVGYSFCAAGPGEAWLVYAVPGPEVEPVTCGFLLRGGEYGHILAGERRLTFDPATGWPLTFEIEAVDEFDRRLSVRGRHAQSTLAGSRWRLTGPLALETEPRAGARTRATSAGPSGRPTGGELPARRSDLVAPAAGRHLIATSTILTTTRASATTR